ncbi:3-hydroxyacyl-CoA dehydrogenase family protein [Rhodoligotrophos defluvii]|uniref:3-hydroxyacyl-CoA dehydrogenase family protein n=1 Tax=Rhodoligotrophos defluvii TaxID=2561934 RepID=UPI0010C9B882|nr:3-hydroxyacyl-CoA dehydrogenase family protein [Rhodoligotrophos defluvii]
MDLNLRTLAVIGNGIIGHGIAEVFSSAGTDTILIGRSKESLARAVDRIRNSLEEFVQQGLLEAGAVAAAITRIRPSTELDDAAAAELVIEAVPEDMALKLAIFERLDQITRPEAVLASSSGHPASELALRVKNKGRVIATHFWYPPQLLPLVEVCGAPETSPETIDWTCAQLRAAGKEPVVIDRELPGFIGNRIQFAILREAWSLWASGAASAEAIDAVVKNSIGRRLGVTGPIESADLAGLDTMFQFASFLQPTLDRSPSPPAAVGERSRSATDPYIHERAKDSWAQLSAARRKELFRWLREDRDRRRLHPEIGHTSAISGTPTMTTSADKGRPSRQ